MPPGVPDVGKLLFHWTPDRSKPIRDEVTGTHQIKHGGAFKT